jgi:hypothetical protein
MKQAKRYIPSNRWNICDLPSTVDELLANQRDKYPNLTDAQHRQRMLAAVHEAGHFLMGAARSTSGGYVRVLRALVCVPGKPVRLSVRRRFKGEAGEGAVQVDAMAPVDDVLIELGGAFAEGICIGDFVTYLCDTPPCGRDIVEAEAMYKKVSASDKPPSFAHLGNITHRYLKKHAGLVEIVAIAFLCWSDSKGVVSAKKTNYLLEQILRHRDFSPLTAPAIYGGEYGARIHG